jgi:hypothetical protein
MKSSVHAAVDGSAMVEYVIVTVHFLLGSGTPESSAQVAHHPNARQ